MKRVVVVGGGLSGLRSADLLLKEKKKNQSCQVVVLEAMDRVGGRLYGVDYKHQRNGKEEVVRLDLGGQWIGPPQQYVSELVEELGIRCVDQFDQGKGILQLTGKQFEFSGNIGTLDIFGKEGLLEKVWDRLDKLAFSVPIEDPYLSPNAAEWDNQSLSDWLEKNVKSEGDGGSSAKQVKNLISWFSIVCLCVETAHTSFLYFLWWLHTGGGYQPLVNIKQGAQHYWIPKSAHHISELLAKRVVENGGKVLLNSQVVHVKQDLENKKTEVTYMDRTTGSYSTLSCDKVIMSTPPAITTQISFTPPLSSTRVGMYQRMPMGCVIKFVLVFKNPWWRESGYSGTYISDTGPIGVMYDKSLDEEGFYSLVGFFTANTARHWSDKSEQERNETILNHMERIYNSKKVRSELVTILLHDWTTEQFTRGCFMCIPAPGGLQGGMKHFRDPFHNVHFVGTETGNVWIGYMDGALESASRVVEELTGVSYRPTAKL
eukprot:CAMPEP_0201476042 /NCGR_PEP_ID=MMETSP0151_2-20130828/1338_1 /ASSEMBLY_ACC=CAM_ASM_000257 /TAXON_ID=200890 /ORGANISM="Paramoeba atlantica, Strain 621/1 / CCAP 1560/9" /LENGTH=487 /DNA_ID=CAMNT_0047856307 /DNA_START=67 /DNA_END=1530 /DNA_ORIENTATION=-